MRPQNALLSATGTTIFTVMSALANQHQAINLGQGFPDYDGPEDVVRAAADALLDGRNQYPPMTGVPELRNAVAAHNGRFYGLEVDPKTGKISLDRLEKPDAPEGSAPAPRHERGEREDRGERRDRGEKTDHRPGRSNREANEHRTPRRRH